LEALGSVRTQWAQTSLAEIENAVANAVASDSDTEKIEEIADYLRRQCPDRADEWRPMNSIWSRQAAALAIIDELPRASVALEDALIGDPIKFLETGRKLLEIREPAAVFLRRIAPTLPNIPER